MFGLMLHHVSVVATNLKRSVSFYEDLFDLKQIERPPFATSGAWLACGDLQVHIVVHPAGTFRQNPSIDNNDAHFAFRTDDFEAVVNKLITKGFREDASDDDPKRLLVFRNGLAGFPQLYVLDPDRNIVEINGAA